jgi:hypothetical protein
MGHSCRICGRSRPNEKFSGRAFRDCCLGRENVSADEVSSVSGNWAPADALARESLDLDEPESLF